MIGATWKVGAVSRTHHPQHTLAGLAATCPPFAGACRLLSLLASLLPLAGSKKGCKTMLGVRGARETGRSNLFLYSFTFSSLFQIDYQLCLQSTIYNRNQTRGGLGQIWIKHQLSVLVVLTYCLLVGCKVLEKDS